MYGEWTSIRDHYLDLWRCYESRPDELERISNIARILYPLLLAVWWFGIALHTEEAAEWVITHWKPEDRNAMFKGIERALAAVSKGIECFLKNGSVPSFLPKEAWMFLK